ncbi:hypothetical protein ACJ41O_003440 [Fusarium nematophilum]
MSSESLPDPTETRVPEMIAVASVLMLISTIVVVLRAMSRTMTRQFGWDDGAAVATLVFILACGATIISMTRYGLGKHITALAPETMILYLRAFWVSIFFYVLALGSVKMTLLLQYLRLMSVSRMRIVIVVSIYIVMASLVAQMFTVMLQCIPIQAVWDPSVKGKCIPHITNMWYFNGIFNIVTDFAILAMPLPVLWRLQLPFAQKAFLTFVVGLGFFTIGVSVARMQWLTPIADLTWGNVTPASWSLAEATTAISCACLPTLKPLVVRAKPFFRKFSTAGDSTVQLQSMDGAMGGAGDIESHSSAVRSNEQLCPDPKEPERVYSYEMRAPVGET